MLLLHYLSIILVLASLTFLYLWAIIGKKNDLNSEKNSRFECGFNHMNSGNQEFSMHFFTMTIMFLIFDIELALILPTSLSMNFNDQSSWLMIMMFFLTILMLGTLLEYKNKAFVWN